MAQLKRPSNPKEAKAIAAVKPGDLTFLHSEPKLSAKEAAASIRALALIGGEPAFAALKTYRGDTRQAVFFALIDAANSFDAKKFSEEILPFDKTAINSYDRPPIKDLALLSRMTSLQDLRLSKEDNTSDLSCLAELPLRSLELVWTSLDLSQLSHFSQLKELRLYQQIKDLASLAVLPQLQKLDVTSQGNLASLHGIESLRQLKEAILDTAAVSDLGPLRTNALLTNLRLIGCEKIVDFSPLSSLLRLETLVCHRAEIAPSLDWVSALSTLKTLVFSANKQISDLSPLASLTNLVSLSLEQCSELCELAPLASLSRLESINLFSSPKLNSLAPLVKLSSLSALKVVACENVDISTLSGVRSLQSLDISQNAHITSLEPLAALTNLRALELRWCHKVTDLSALSSLKNLEELNLYWCNGVSDLSPLLELPKLRALNRDHTSAKNIPPELQKLVPKTSRGSTTSP